MTAQELYNSLSHTLAESNCDVFEAVGVLEVLKADVLAASSEGEGEEGEESK